MDNESGVNRKEIPGKEVEVVLYGRDERRGALRTKEGYGKEITRDKEEGKT